MAKKKSKKKSYDTAEKQALEIILIEVCEELCRDHDIEYELHKEFKFNKDRRFLADYCILTDFLRLIVEFEGLNFVDPRFSRHTNPMGYAKDADKYSLAAEGGFFLLRYTVLNLKNEAMRMDVRRQVRTLILKQKYKYDNLVDNIKKSMSG